LEYPHFFVVSGRTLVDFIFGKQFFFCGDVNNQPAYLVFHQCFEILNKIAVAVAAVGRAWQRGKKSSRMEVRIVRGNRRKCRVACKGISKSTRAIKKSVENRWLKVRLML